MFLTNSLSAADGPSPGTCVSICPYRQTNSMYCSASVMTFAIAKRQDAAYCSSENFDNCPVFLAKVLRRN